MHTHIFIVKTRDPPALTTSETFSPLDNKRERLAFVYFGTPFLDPKSIAADAGTIHCMCAVRSTVQADAKSSIAG